MAWHDGFDGAPNVTEIPGTGTVVTGKGGRQITVYQLQTGYDVILRPDLMQSAWAQYQVAAPLTRVWQGDDATAPTLTVQLQFSDETTAKTVMAGCWS